MNETAYTSEKTGQRNTGSRVPASVGAEFNAILEATADGIVVLNAAGIEYANPSMSELLGIPPYELEDHDFDWPSLLPSTARNAAKQVVHDVLQGSQPARKVTFTVMTRHLGERHFAASLTRVTGDEPKLLGIVHDVSDHVDNENRWKLRVELLEEMRRANQLLLAQNPSVEQIRASMEILCHATGADRVCLQITPGLVFENGSETTDICVGERSDCPPLPIPAQWQTPLAANRPMSAVVADLPEEERENLGAQGVQVFLAFPIMAGEVCRGMIRFDRMSTDILWSEGTIVLLRTAINTWGSSLSLVEIRCALANSEARFRRLIENSQDLIYRMSLPEGHYEYVSPAIQNITGYTVEEFKTSPMLIRDIVHPGWWNYFETQWGKLLAGDMAPTYEYAIIHGKTGEIRWLYQRNVLLKDESGVPTAIEGIVTDITARKRAEMALHAQESMLKSVFRAAPVGIGLLSNRTFLQVNDRLCEMSGYSVEELIGRNARLLYPTETDYNYVGEEKYAQIKDRGMGTVETRWQRKDGTTINVLLSSTPLDAADLSAGVTFTALDITDRKHAEDQVRASLYQKELLIKEIHHRVKNNLAVISSLLGLQAMQIEDQHAAQVLRKSRDRVYAMAHVHEHLYRSPDASQVNMEDLFIILVRELVVSHASSVTTTVSAPNVYLNVDQATPCSLILNELVTNSLDHAFPKERVADRAPHITVALTECEGILTLIVEDNGIGMPPTQPQSHTATLGMDVINVLVNQLNGRCKFETHQGTQVVVNFPRAEIDAREIG